MGLSEGLADVSTLVTKTPLVLLPEGLLMSERKDPEVKKAEAQLDEWGAGVRKFDASEAARDAGSFRETVEARLDEARADLDRLAAKAKKGAAGIEGRLEDLDGREETLREDLEAFGEEGKQRAEAVRDDIQEATERLREELDELKAKVQ